MSSFHTNVNHRQAREQSCEDCRSRQACHSQQATVRHSETDDMITVFARLYSVLQTQPRDQQLTRLPYDIWLEIVPYIAIEDLKSLRYASRQLETAVTPLLFSHIAVSPNMNSVNRAKRIADTPHLARHVRSLAFHASRLNDGFSDLRDFKEEVLRLREAYPKPYSSTSANLRDTWTPKWSKDNGLNEAAAVLRMHQCYLQELQSHYSYLQTNKVGDLRYVCSRLINLRAIQCVDGTIDSNLDNYISRRTGILCDLRVLTQSPDVEHASMLLGASATNQIEEIRLLGSWNAPMNPWLFFERHLLYGTSIRLLDLRMGSTPENSIADTIEFEKCRDRLLGFLDRFPNVRDLRLDFRHRQMSIALASIYWAAPRRHLLSLTEQMLSRKWHALERVCLFGIVLNENCLIDFLTSHASTLKYTEFHNVMWFRKSGNCGRWQSRTCRLLLPTIHSVGYGGVINVQGEELQ